MAPTVSLNQASVKLPSAPSKIKDKLQHLSVNGVTSSEETQSSECGGTHSSEGLDEQFANDNKMKEQCDNKMKETPVKLNKETKVSNEEKPPFVEETFHPGTATGKKVNNRGGGRGNGRYKMNHVSSPRNDFNRGNSFQNSIFATQADPFVFNRHPSSGYQPPPFVPGQSRHGPMQPPMSMYGNPPPVMFSPRGGRGGFQNFGARGGHQGSMYEMNPHFAGLYRGGGGRGRGRGAGRGAQVGGRGRGANDGRTSGTRT